MHVVCWVRIIVHARGLAVLQAKTGPLAGIEMEKHEPVVSGIMSRVGFETLELSEQTSKVMLHCCIQNGLLHVNNAVEKACMTGLFANTLGDCTARAEPSCIACTYRLDVVICVVDYRP